MSYTIDDRRKDNATPFAYVIATDTFLSGWGHAPGRSLFAVPCASAKEAEAVELAMRNRSEMKHPRIMTGIRANGTPKVRLHPGDHLSIRDRNDASEFYRGAAAFRD